MELQTRFNQFVRQNNLLDPSDKILITVSGGKDSILLLELFRHEKYEIAVAHCNFNLRGEESAEEAEFVEAHCRQMGVPFFVKKFEVEPYVRENQVSVQMACRTLRYEWFQSIASQHGFTKIATGHHADDQVETMLINLLRGSGPEGLKGIPIKRDLYIRPILFLTSAEIENAIDNFKLPFRTDSSNLSPKYLRNQIRLEIIPILQRLRPDVAQAFRQSSEIMADVSVFIRTQVSAWELQHFRKIPNGYKICFESLLVLYPRKLWLYELFKKFGFTDPVIRDLDRFLDNSRTDEYLSGTTFESTTHSLQVDRHDVFLVEKNFENTSVTTQQTLIIAQNAVSSTYEWASCRVTFQQQTFSQDMLHAKHSNVLHVDADRLNWSLGIRSWRLGDRFKPIGMNGRHKKISDLLVSKKVPNWQKNQIPILVNGDGEIVWVMGLQGSETFKITGSTQNVLTISYFCEYG